MIHHDRKEKRDGLCELIKEKILLFRKFLSLSESMKEMLEKENMIRIRVLLRQRQDHMNRIDRLDVRIKTWKNEDQKGPSPNMEKRLLSLLKELEEIIKKAIRADEDCADLALSRIEGLRTDLVRVSAGKQGVSGYRGKAQQKPRFLDMRT
jgi:hypothetical protein